MRPFGLVSLLGCAGLLAACNPTPSPSLPQVASDRARSLAMQYGHEMLVVEPDPAFDPTYGPEVNVIGGDTIPLPSSTDDSGNTVTEKLAVPLAIDASPGRTHACAIAAATGGVYCWGDQTRGALGIRTCKPPKAKDGPPDCILNAALIGSLPPARAVFAGDDVSCVIIEDHDRVVCWGAAERTGGSELFALDPPTPVTLPGGDLLAASRLLMLEGAVCAIDHAKTMWCWGDGYGATPVRQPYTGVLDYAANDNHTCIIDADGFRCWGDNRNGQIDFAAAQACSLDQPCRIDEPHPMPLAATHVAVGERHTCAIKADGAVLCWGSNEVGQLGREDAYLLGPPEQILDGVHQLAGDFDRTCAFRGDRDVLCWGGN